MRVMVLGSGGREDVLAQALSHSPDVVEVIVTPGRERLRPLEKITNVPIQADDTAALIRLAHEHAVDLIVPGPEAPLVAGFADAARRAGLNVFGPSAAVAILTEGSKCAAKRFMARNHIPTAEPFRCFGPGDQPSSFIHSLTLPIVVKDDELAGGKGVTIAKTRKEAFAAADQLSGSGHGYVVEPYLNGWEMTYACLVAGESFLPLASSRDHKVFNGKMTGGMAAVSPEPRLTPELEAKIIDRILRPTIQGLTAEGYCYTGFLYLGLMIVDDEPYLLEYNCRLGDPEAQVILPRLSEDLANVLYTLVTSKSLLMAAPGGSLPLLRWDTRAAATVVLAAEGYPGTPVRGAEIFGIKEVEAIPNVELFHAGTSLQGDTVIVNGGRVLNVTAFGSSVRNAAERAYAAARMISWQGMQMLQEIPNLD